MDWRRLSPVSTDGGRAAQRALGQAGMMNGRKVSPQPASETPYVPQGGCFTSSEDLTYQSKKGMLIPCNLFETLSRKQSETVACLTEVSGSKQKSTVRVLPGSCLDKPA